MALLCIVTCDRFYPKGIFETDQERVLDVLLHVSVMFDHQCFDL